MPGLTSKVFAKCAIESVVRSRSLWRRSDSRRLSIAGGRISSNRPDRRGSIRRSPYLTIDGIWLPKNFDTRLETFSVPVKDVQTENVDAAAVMVQTGAANAPKLMLGAAQITVQ